MPGQGSGDYTTDRESRVFAVLTSATIQYVSNREIVVHVSCKAVLPFCPEFHSPVQRVVANLEIVGKSTLMRVLKLNRVDNLWSPKDPGCCESKHAELPSSSAAVSVHSGVYLLHPLPTCPKEHLAFRAAKRQRLRVDKLGVHLAMIQTSGTRRGHGRQRLAKPNNKCQASKIILPYLTSWGYTASHRSFPFYLRVSSHHPT